MANKKRSKGIPEPLGDDDYIPVCNQYFDREDILVAHQIESFNTFINEDLDRIIKQYTPLTFFERTGEIFTEETRNVKFFRVTINFKGIELTKPHIEEVNGRVTELFPSMARARHFTYHSPFSIKLNYEISLMDKEGNVLKQLRHPDTLEKMGYIPVMLKSKLCNLHGLSREGFRLVREDPYDYGGYFIVKGTEKFVVPQEKRVENHVFMFKNKNPDADYSVVAEVKSVRDDTVSRLANVKVKYKRQNDELYVTINPGFAAKDIQLSIMFRALGIETDREIAEYCVWNMDDSEMIELLRPSLSWERRDVKTGRTIKYRSRAEALLYLAENYLPVHQKFESDVHKQKYILGLIDKYFFPHVKDDTVGVKIRKAKFLGYVVRKVLLGKLDQIPSDDRDDLGNKRIDLVGPLMAQLFKSAFSSTLDNMKKNIIKEFLSKVPTTEKALSGLVSRTKNINLMINPFKSSLSTGTWKTSANKLNARIGVAQLLQRKSRMDTLSNLRRVFTPSTGGSAQLKNAEIRRLHASQYGMIDPLETPDGAQTGVVKHLAATCTVSIASNPRIIQEVLMFLNREQKGVIRRVEELPIMEAWKLTPILINGDWWASTEKPDIIIQHLRLKRRNLQIDAKTGIVWDFDLNEIRISTDGGRCLRPLYIVDKGNKLKMNKEILKKLVDPSPITRWKWDDLIGNAIIEYIDTHESEFNVVIGEYPSTLREADPQLKIFSHCEIHPVLMLGTVIGLIPYPEHNQAPRDLFQGSMAKQSLDIYSTTFPIRMDTAAHVLHYPEKPMVTTYMAGVVDFDKLPAGINIVVAIAMYTGYNQEDSVILNKSSVQRGLFISTTYKSYKEEAKNDEKFVKPDPNRTVGIKNHANYEKLNQFGIVPPGTIVEKDDVLIGKVTALDRSERTGQIDQRDVSVMMKEEHGIVDQVITDTNDEGYEIYKVKIRILKIPQIGDKFCFDKDTDVLTFHGGWKNIRNVTSNDIVATLRNGTYLEYQKPTGIFAYDHDGPMFRVCDDMSVDLLVTLNHKMYVSQDKPYAEIYKLVEAKDLLGKYVAYKKDALWTKGDLEGYSDDWIVFFGLCYRANVVLHTSENLVYFFEDLMSSEVKSLLEQTCKALNWTITKHEDQGRWDVLCPTMSEYFGLMGRWVFSLSTRQTRVLLDAIFVGDPKCDECFKMNFDHIQQLCLHAGWSADKDETGRIFVNKNSEDKDYIGGRIEYYRGKVYCLEVPNHVLYVRRNFKAVWSGNSNRSGQKGVCGMMYGQWDMPFTESGIVPDIIMNPQAIPSRMTISMLLELVTGKACAVNGTIADATGFTGINVDDVIKELKDTGFNEFGYEEMYNGFTGEKMQAKIFVGPTYYQRLKHMVVEKIHARAGGAVQMLTRQPLEGRAREGGLRFGEPFRRSQYKILASLCVAGNIPKLRGTPVLCCA